ncbi:MAG TPA: serine hydrolase domain-containing protein [Longimicrobiales bacterium]|nr:serine hydrolase domain-containing protein [Longimicrobiales bacterium]
MRTVRLVVAFLAAVATGTPGLHAQQPSQAAVDAIFAAYDQREGPGCALAVVRDGKIEYQRGYGYANLDYGIRNSPDMVYYVGSVSKQFTAAAVALLAQEGRISLDADVRDYFPELPDYGRTMTIRHLVHHTSGLRDIYTLMMLAGIRLEDVFTDEAALSLIARQRELNFLPGDDYLYSNSGYWLLGQLVERVTGQSLRAYADERIFRPLGMHDTHFHDEPQHVFRNRVISYGGNAGDGYRITYLQNFDKVGAGGLYTTLGDLAKWDANFYEASVGGAAFLETMHRRGVLTTGDTLSYAFGLGIGQRRGLDVVRHAGALMGFRADMARYPEERFTVITLCNHGAIDASALADRVADLYLGHRLQPVEAGTAVARAPAPATATPDGPPEAGRLAGVDGVYRSPELEADWRLTVRDGALLVTLRATPDRVARPAGADAYDLGGQVVLRLERDAAGTVTGFTVDAGRVRNIRFERQP